MRASHRHGRPFFCKIRNYMLSIPLIDEWIKVLRVSEHKNLRDRLRQETRACHERVDEFVSQFDLAETSGRAALLLGHYEAHRIFADADRAPPCWLKNSKDRIELDLTDNDLQPLEALEKNKSAHLPERHNAGESYVLLGSHLGSKTLLARMTKNSPSFASAFLSNPVLPPEWRRLCETLFNAPPVGEAADAVVEGAKATFQFYQTCFEHSRQALAS